MSIMKSVNFALLIVIRKNNWKAIAAEMLLKAWKGGSLSAISVIQ